MQEKPMPELRAMMRLVRSAERLARRISDPSTSRELFTRLCTQHHLLQRRLYAWSLPR